MIRNVLSSLAVVTVLAGCTFGGGASAPPPRGASTAAPTGPSRLGEPTSETIGGISLGLDAARIHELLGPPDAKGEMVEMGATGEFEADWTWPAKGLVLRMAAPTATDAPHVSAITIRAPSDLRTSRGVGVGSARADVEATYAAYLGKGREPDEPDTTSPTQLIVGSIYGGTFFTFAGGKVTEIFVGAGAE